MAKPFEVSDDSFQADVLQSDKPVLVDFWADWCGPCRMIAPSVSAMAEEYEDVLRVAKMDVDDNPAVPGRYGIIGIHGTGNRGPEQSQKTVSQVLINDTVVFKNYSTHY